MELNEFTKAELKTIADKFGTELTADDKNKDSIVNKLVDDGVDVELVFSQIPELKSRYTVEDANVVTSGAVNADPAETEVKVITQQEFVPKPQEKFLMKMERANAYYEVGKYTFTEQHPYALVDASDYTKVLNEGGFRQATPDELQEYYDLATK